MEVHHHAHLASGETHSARKKWTHYFWEFLMLFLAVTLGFFVENQREHYIEHQREKQYMRSMIEDLRFDTSGIRDNMNLRKQRIQMIDSLIYNLRTSNYTFRRNEIYYFARHISPPLNFFPNDRTIQQLKSSGGLRLVRNVEISNSIMAYDQKMRSFLFDQADEIELRSEYREIAAEVFDGDTFSEMIKTDEIEKPTTNPALFNTTPAIINKLKVKAQYLKKLDQSQIARAAELRKQATALIDVIKGEYHLN